MNTKQTNTPKCSQCGSPLIFVSEEVVQPEGARYPQTNTIYKCSNEECQKKKDKERNDREKMQQKRADAEEKRLTDLSKKRKAGQAKQNFIPDEEESDEEEKEEKN